MKSILYAVAFLATLLAADESNNWPHYLDRCNSDELEDDSNCLLIAANKALPEILKGDPELNIPEYDQFVMEHVTFGEGETWKLHFNKVIVSGFQHYVISDIKWDLAEREIKIDLKLFNAQVCSGTYESNGTYGDKPLNGKGDMDLILLGGNSSYHMKYDIIQIDGRNYIQINESDCVCHKDLRFNFYNSLKTKQENEAANAYLNAHVDIGKDAIMTKLAEILCLLINTIINPILYNYSIDEIVPGAK